VIGDENEGGEWESRVEMRLGETEKVFGGGIVGEVVGEIGGGTGEEIGGEAG
jgi:hypothetical protein